MQAIARGDEQSLAILYDRYNRILFSLVLRILSDREAAEDVLQEVFLQVWRTASKFDERRGRVFTWLAVMARSRALDLLRSESSRRRTREAVEETMKPQDQQTDGLKALQQSETRLKVSQALGELSEVQRQTLLLAYFQGLSQTEIAERTGDPLGTVKTRIRSSMIRLRELLKEENPGNGGEK